MQINSLNHFRAIAIIFIVTGHSYNIFDMRVNGLIDGILKSIITGGTSFFVFISGLLFHHVFYQRYNYHKFIKNKINNVLIPYLILGFIPICLRILQSKGEFQGYFLSEGDGVFSQYIIPFLKYYMTGGFIVAYWYIPFIVLTFLLSPLHIKFIQQKLPVQLFIIGFLSLVAVFMHRPILNISVVQNVLYFSPVYLIGIVASIHRESICRFCKGKEWVLLIVAIAIACFQASIGMTENYHKPPFEFEGVDVMFIQKIFLCFFLMTWLNKFEYYDKQWIKTLAATSFAIFFLHPYLLSIFRKTDLDILNQDSWVILLLFVFALLASCIAIAKLTKIILPKYSRNLIGY